MFVTFFVQLYVALYKNMLVLSGRKLAVLFTLLLPSLVLLVLYIAIVSILAKLPTADRLSVEAAVMRYYGGGGLIAASAVGQSVILVNAVAMEKRSQLLQTLRLLSLSEAVYWLSWLLIVAAIAVFGTWISIAFGAWVWKIQAYSSVDGMLLMLLHSMIVLSTIALMTIVAAVISSPMTISLVIFFALALTGIGGFLSGLAPAILGGLSSLKWFWWIFAPMPSYHFLGVYMDVVAHVYYVDPTSGAIDSKFYGWECVRRADEITQQTFQFTVGS
jgi:hypothetical protein